MTFSLASETLTSGYSNAFGESMLRTHEDIRDNDLLFEAGQLPQQPHFGQHDDIKYAERILTRERKSPRIVFRLSSIEVCVY